MKKLYSFILCVILITHSYAQSNNRVKHVEAEVELRHAADARFENKQLFSVDNIALQRSSQLQPTVHNGTVMNVNMQTLTSIVSSRPDNIELSIPVAQGSITLELYRVNLFTGDFSVVAASTNQAVNYDGGVHYRGVVKGEKNTLTAISIFNDEVMGFVSYNNKNYVIGKLQNDASNRHIFYAETDLQASPSTECYTPNDGMQYTNEQLRNGLNSTQTTNCVRLYWEVNYDIYQGKGSVVNATNYVTGIFNQSATIYTNDGVSVTLSQVLVWDIASPYTATSTSSILSQFQSYRTSFNGDLGNLLGYAGGGGVAAGFDGICNALTTKKMCYSGVGSNYSTVPTYSWTVMVVTHEQGHLLGSRHTHACVWNGNNTAIDGCAPSAGYAYEGSCSGAPIPANGGTIMSYCHLTNVGINFTLGFGPQPLAVILNKINNGACLSVCGTTTCAVPAGLSSTNVTNVSAALSWASTGANSYNLQWKAASASIWNTVSGITTTTYNLGGLAACSSYNYQVQGVCTSNSSAYSAAASFTTTGCSVYCNAGATNSSSEYINRVTFGSINNTSGNNGGYADYTALSTNLTAGSQTITLVPGFVGTPVKQAWRVYIDYNHNGVFTDLGEAITIGVSKNTMNKTFTVPTTALNGPTRMRVMMRRISYATSCLVYSYGEVEDYTVVITGNAITPVANETASASAKSLKTENISELKLYPNPAQDNFTIEVLANSNGAGNINIYNITGEKVLTLVEAINEGRNKLDINTSLLTNGFYLLEMDVNGAVIREKFAVSK